MDDFASFTLAYFERALDRARQQYRFAGSDLGSEHPSACWRHDIDYDLATAVRFAEIEHDLGLRCVFHVMVSSCFYNVISATDARSIRMIADLGHEIGLHVDLDVFPGGMANKEVFETRVKREIDVLTSVAETELVSLSFHNHAMHQRHSWTLLPTVLGLRNLAAPAFYADLAFLSDSNGIWRKEPLMAFVDRPPTSDIQVLLHPIWWREAPLSPWDRFLAFLGARNKAAEAQYIEILKKDGRFESTRDRLGVSSGGTNV